MQSEKGTLRGSIIFYSFVFGCVIIAFIAGFYLGKEVERNDWVKRIDKAKQGQVISRL